MPTRRWNSSALRTASCPVRASATYSTSVGSATSRSSASSAMSASSMWRRPAVSTRTASWPTARASARAERRIARGSARSGWWTFTPACAPTVRSCSRAAGRWTSVDTRRGWRPRPASQRPSLAVVVVLPEPWRPVIRITVGGRDADSSGLGSAPPRTATISSRTTRRTAWSGVRLFRTSCPVARARTLSTICFVTLKWTSASRRAIRISRSAASTWASERTPWPRRDLKIPWSLSLSDSNTQTYPRPGASQAKS